MEPAARHSGESNVGAGDTHKVDFSRALIFMTSNVGASEMSAILNSRVGFASPHRAEMEARRRQ